MRTDPLEELGALLGILLMITLVAAILWFLGEHVLIERPPVTT